MKKLYKWLCEQFPGYEIKLTKDDIHCDSSDLQIYVGKFTSPYVGYLGHCHYKDIICNFKFYTCSMFLFFQSHQLMPF